MQSIKQKECFMHERCLKTLSLFSRIMPSINAHLDNKSTQNRYLITKKTSLKAFIHSNELYHKTATSEPKLQLGYNEGRLSYLRSSNRIIRLQEVKASKRENYNV